MVIGALYEIEFVSKVITSKGECSILSSKVIFQIMHNILYALKTDHELTYETLHRKLSVWILQ